MGPGPQVDVATTTQFFSYSYVLATHCRPGKDAQKKRLPAFMPNSRRVIVQPNLVNPNNPVASRQQNRLRQCSP